MSYNDSAKRKPLSSYTLTKSPGVDSEDDTAMRPGSEHTTRTAATAQQRSRNYETVEASGPYETHAAGQGGILKTESAVSSGNGGPNRPYETTTAKPAGGSLAKTTAVGTVAAADDNDDGDSASVLSVDSVEQELLEFQINEAEKCLASREWTDAEETIASLLVNASLDLNSKREWTFKHAVVLSEQGKWAEALGVLKGAESGGQEEMAMLAKVYFRLGNLEEAKEICYKAIKAHRKNPNSTLNINESIELMADIMDALGKKVEARFYRSKLPGGHNRTHTDASRPRGEEADVSKARHGSKIEPPPPPPKMVFMGQSLIPSRTMLDDSEYVMRFNRLEGMIKNLAFEIRRDWKTIPEWLRPVFDPGVEARAKREMTTVGCAVISRWIVEEVFEAYFHPGLDPAFSSNLKLIENNLIRSRPQTSEEDDALFNKIRAWRASTVDGIRPILDSPACREYKASLIEHLSDRLVDGLGRYLAQMEPSVAPGVRVIVELAIAIAAYLPLESRYIRVWYPLPGEPYNTAFMRPQEGLAPLTAPMAQAMMDIWLKPQPGQERIIRVASFMAVEVRTKSILMMAPVWLLN